MTASETRRYKIYIKCHMKSMTYTLLESHAYDNVLVKKLFLHGHQFFTYVRTYVRTYSDLLNPEHALPVC